MKTNVTISELTHEDLVDLLCTATYGSNWLDCDAPDRDGVDITEADTREDVWAKCLLAGKPLACIDYYAEGETYGNKGNAVINDDGDESACYLLYLEDFLDGLAKCVDGTFNVSDDEYGKRDRAWIKECYAHFSDPDEGRMEMDQPEAEALMQVIMFNEVVYG